ncbi:MAG: septation regulator SpoVG [Spirochaetes bacterium]|nr:septation regulator SpoVG [Spirochaetota bacterium]
MEITDIRIKKVEKEGNLLGYASVTFDDVFVVHNIRVMSGRNGNYIMMPNRKVKSGEFKDIAHPINTDFRRKMESSILEAYDSLE